ncbi:glycosyltransferase family 9 protein [Parabacteroides bouchesdurhonensis]|uniref:glycosyltransferase family 9 protein n=1 Tax=Parabacteroides bouchesdurhonensis TaxID=1936995 RepID=UPI000C8547CC|nr:glycosyltransferase family 9 protein [Parabacteroides bouchesdurhonensis]
MAKILVIRLSAIGDVAMTVPVIYSAARSNPQDTFTVLTQAFLMPIFMNRPANVNVIGINTKASEKTLRGLLKFASALVKYDFDIVLDLHDVIRSMIVRTLFRIKGKPVYVLDKARKERARLTDQKNKDLRPLRPVIERYADVFRSAGLNYVESFTSLYESKPADLSRMESIAGVKNGKWVGIAPFAKHQGKIYPIESMEQVVAGLVEREDITVFLFGAKGYEEAVLEDWAYQYPRVKNVVGRYALNDELALISQLDLLVCMDSANMHFASLVGTRVLSIWGATHPYTGFYGYRQQKEDTVQLDLSCRPCSIFGDKSCFRGDWACMASMKPETILSKIYSILGIEYPYKVEK